MTNNNIPPINLSKEQWIALANWLVPEENVPPGALKWIDAFENPDLYDQLEVGKSLRSQELRQRLLAETDRAEAGG